MDRPPRPIGEPIIDRQMRLGMMIQTFAISTVVLIAYSLGLKEGETLHGVGSTEAVRLARTMAFVTLSASELLRAYTARSERTLLVRLGIFGNRYMQYAVGISLILLLGVVYLPFLQPVFDTVSLSLRDMAAIVPLLFVPALVAEIGKWLGLRRSGRTGSSRGRLKWQNS